MQAQGAYEPLMRFVNESMYLWESAITQWSQRPWLILVPVVQRFELVALPTTNQLQSCAGLFYLSASQRLDSQEELSLLTCKG